MDLTPINEKNINELAAIDSKEYLKKYVFNDDLGCSISFESRKAIDESFEKARQLHSDSEFIPEYLNKVYMKNH